MRSACRQYPYATVYDYSTGISWQVHMFSYGKHAEAEPLTAADTAKLEQAFGGNTWTPKAVWVIFADGTVRMATTHSMPHEVQHITDNNFPRSPVHPLPAHAGAGKGDRPLRHEPPADGGKGLGGNAGDDCELIWIYKMPPGGWGMSFRRRNFALNRVFS